MTSQRPELYWRPWLGDVCGLRPADMADLTPQQLAACRAYAEGRVTFDG